MDIQALRINQSIFEVKLSLTMSPAGLRHAVDLNY